MGYQKFMAIGNVGTDPSMRYTASGSAVTSFRLAVNRRYTAGGERRDETEWFTVVAWNQLAETINQYVEKGNEIFVEGRVGLKSWEANDGTTRYSMEINAQNVQFLGGRNNGEREIAPVPQMDGEAGDPGTPEDLPW